MDFLPLSHAFLTLSPFSFPCILSLVYVPRILSLNSLANLLFLTCLMSPLESHILSLVAGLSSLAMSYASTTLITPHALSASLQWGELGYTSHQRGGMDLQVYTTRPRLLMLYISWLIVVNIYKLTEAGNSNSSQMGDSCQGNGYGTDKTGRQPVHII
jgi:hypothetical protein